MGGDSNKIITKKVVPVIIGSLICIFFHFGFIYIASFFLSGEEEPSEVVIDLIMFFIPALTGSFVTAFIFRYTKFNQSILTSVLFLFFIFTLLIIVPASVISPKQFNTFFITIIIMIVTAGMLGGYIGIRLKKRKNITKYIASSPPDIP